MTAVTNYSSFVTNLTAVKFAFPVAWCKVRVVSSEAVNPGPGEPATRRRGDKHRQAIMTAVRELLEEKPFGELSVSSISQRAGVARSGFYFYFDSKYAVLAQIMAEATEELEELTQYFAPRQPGESPEQFAKRMVVFRDGKIRHDDPVKNRPKAAEVLRTLPTVDED